MGTHLIESAAAATLDCASKEECTPAIQQAMRKLNSRLDDQDAKMRMQAFEIRCCPVGLGACGTRAPVADLVS